MTNNEYMNPDEERIDALDHLIFRELGRQDAWRQMMQQWEARQRKQRRLRLLPVISNIASVAALFVMGLFLQAMLPTTNVSTAIIPADPSPEVTGVQDSVADGQPSDSIQYEGASQSR